MSSESQEYLRPILGLALEHKDNDLIDFVSRKIILKDTKDKSVYVYPGRGYLPEKDPGTGKEVKFILVDFTAEGHHYKSGVVSELELNGARKLEDVEFVAYRPQSVAENMIINYYRL